MPFNITSTGGSGGGAPGPRGPQGIAGEDALWNYTGEYNGGVPYAVGDLATYDGQLWYRANANGGNVGDTPSDGFIWNLIAAKGTNGAGFDPITVSALGIFGDGSSEWYSPDSVGSLNNVWSVGTRVRLSQLSNRSIFVVASIDTIYEPERTTFHLTIEDDYSNGADLNIGQWVMEATGATGIGFNFRGPWVTDTLYLKNDVVTQNGSSYIANYDYQDNDGPSLDGDLWATLAAKGTDGTNGSGGLVYLGDYVLGNGYVANLAIVKGSDNNLYIAKSSGGLADPVGNTAEWDIFSNNATSDLGDFQFTAATANVNNSQTLRLESRRWDGTQASSLTLSPGDPSAAISATEMQGNSFSNQWSSATWSGQTVDILNATDIINWLNEITGYSNVQRVIINEGSPITITSLGWTATDVQFGVDVSSEDVTQITGITFIYSTTSQIRLDYDNGAIDINGNRMNINLTTTQGRDISIISSDDATLRASGDDLNLHAKDDIRFISSWDNADHSWTMDSEGRLQLPGNGYIENPKDSSGDGYLNDTLKLVPDNLLDSDQYLIIDPTAPNHIHIRAGGVQDYSNAELILGGERAGVHVSDPSGDVWVQTKKEDYNWSWQNVNPNDGTTYITNSSMSEPDIGDFTVQDGIKYIITSVSRDEPNGNTAYMATGSNGELLNFVSLAYYTFTRDNGNYTWRFEAIDDAPALVLPPEEPVIVNMAVPGDITLSAYNGIKIAASSGFGIEFPDQTVQTTAYIPGGDAPVEVIFSVNGGTTAAQPTFNGTPLFSGSYVRTGQLVHFQIQVDMDNISDFGTGQFYVDLPFAAKYGYQFKEGCLHDISTSKQYAIGGHVAANTERLFLTFTNSSGQDELFDHNSPITLNAEDNFHIAGTYIAS